MHGSTTEQAVVKALRRKKLLPNGLLERSVRACVPPQVKVAKKSKRALQLDVD